LSENDDGTSYGRLTRAWTLLMGRNLHYGYFEDPGDDLDAATARLTRRMTETACLDGGPSVLDVGCGVGTPACHLAESFGCDVTGISTSEIGVREATRLAAARGLAAKVRFLVRDGMDNGLPGASFDRVWVMQASHLMLQKEKLFAESARVLRPGGRMVLCDIILGGPLSMRAALEYRREFLLLHRVFGRAKMETLDAYASFAERSGLAVETREDVTRATRPTFDRWRRNAADNRDQVVALLGEESWREFVDACDVLERLWDAGKLGYGLFAAVKPSA